MLKKGLNFFCLTIILTNFLISNCYAINDTQVISAKNTYEPVYKQMQDLRLQGDLNEAIILGEQHIKDYPKDSDVLLMLGLINYQTKNYTKAIDYFEQTLDNTPDYQAAIIGLGKTYVALKNYSKAKLIFNSILKDDPKNKEVRIELINIALISNNRATALRLINDGLAYYPDDPDLLFHKAKVDAINKKLASTQVYKQMQNLRLKGDLNKALIIGKNHIKTNPKDSDVLLMLGLINYQTKNYSKALDYFQKTLNNTPDYQAAIIGLGKTYVALNNYSKARLIFNRLLKEEPKNKEVRIELVQIEVASSNIKKALSLINDGLSYFPKDRDLLVQKNKVKVLEKKRAHDYVYKQMQKLRQKDHLTKALILGKRHIKSYPKDSDVLFMLGLIHHQKKHYRSAIYYFKQTLKITPGYHDAKIGLGRTYLALNNYSKAKLIFSNLLAANPKDKKARIELIRTELTTIDNKKALCLIHDGLTYHPNDPDLLVEKAKVYETNKQFAYAANIYKQILRQSNSNEAYSNLKEIHNLNPSLLNGLNTIGFLTEYDYVSDLKDPWIYSNIYYQRDNCWGSYILNLNNASRFGINANQFMVNLNPAISQNAYISLVGAYANQPVLFPTYLIGIEPFLSNQDFEFSFGYTYRYIIRGIEFAQYTFSISKEFKDLWISFRPNFYRPISGVNSLLYTATIIKYFNYRDTYLRMNIGSGTSPDLADLLTVDFVQIKNNYINLILQFPVFHNHSLLMNIGADYQHWRFPQTGRIRNITGGMLGFNYRF